MTWASGSSDYFDLSEVLPANISVQPYVGPFNGNTQFDVRAFIKPTDLSQTRCVWASTGAFNTVKYFGGDVGGGGLGYLCTESDGKLHGMLNVSGTLIKVASTSALTVSTVYEVELNLDSSHNVNLFVGTGGTVTRVAQVASGGTAITQRADESDTIGYGAAYWPYSITPTNWQGAIQSIQISNTARNTGTSYTEDTANFATDGNTLFLDNFNLNQFVGGAAVSPITQVNTPTNGWMALHIGELGCCGGTYNVSGLNIGAGTVGIYADGASVDISHVTNYATQYGIEISRTAGFNSFVHDITETPGAGNGQGVAGILSLGGITFIRDVILNQAQMFPIYTTGSSVVNAYIATNNRNACGVAAETGGQGVNVLPVHLEHIVQDTENGGTFPSICITGVSGNGPISVTGSVLAPSGTASAIQLIGGVGQVTLQGNNFIQSATAYVDTTYAPFVQDFNTTGESIIFDNNTYNGVYAPLGGATYTNFNFPYSVIGHTPTFHHLQVPVVPTLESGASFVGSSCNGNTTCAYPVPADAHVGDVEIADIDISGGAPGTVTLPAGWQAGCVSNNGANGSYTNIAWHVVTPDDTATYTWTIANAALIWDGGIVALSGVNQLAPIDQCVTTTASSATSIALTGMTAGDQNDVDLIVASNGNACCSRLLTVSSPPANLLAVFLGRSTISPRIWSYLPASTTLPTITVNDTASDAAWTGMQIAVRPALSQSSLMAAGQGSPPLYQGESGAPLGSVRLSAAALATFGTCGTSSAGTMARENNSTAACSAGVTATSSGTTPCFVVCNGTNWLQTGY
jgi:hypothetical protein